MLHTKTVDAETLVLIKELMQKDYLQDFYLVGGTALALQIGHRTSTDIDLFNYNKFDKEVLIQQLKVDFGDLIFSSNLLGIFANMKNVKTDIIYHPYKSLEQPLLVDGIRMLSKKDIASMKLSAITRMGKNKEDNFIRSKTN